MINFLKRLFGRKDPVESNLKVLQENTERARVALEKARIPILSSVGGEFKVLYKGQIINVATDEVKPFLREVEQQIHQGGEKVDVIPPENVEAVFGEDGQLQEVSIVETSATKETVAAKRKALKEEIKKHVEEKSKEDMANEVEDRLQENTKEQVKVSDVKVYEGLSAQQNAIMNFIVEKYGKDGEVRNSDIKERFGYASNGSFSWIIRDLKNADLIVTSRKNGIEPRI